MIEKITTIENLAAMIQRTMASKEDFKRVEEVQKDTLEELNATHEDVRYIRSTVNILVQSDVAHEAAIEELKARVYRLEQRAGVAT